MHPVAHFAHSLKRLFTTCRVFSGSFTGKACIQRAIKVNTVHYTTHVRTSWCMRERLGRGWRVSVLAGKSRQREIPRNLNGLRMLRASSWFHNTATSLPSFKDFTRKRKKKQMKQIKVDLPDSFSFQPSAYFRS